MPRELIEPHKGDKRYVRRSKGGQFKESDDAGRSLAADIRTKARVIAATKSARSSRSQEQATVFVALRMACNSGAQLPRCAASQNDVDRSKLRLLGGSSTDIARF
jgi:hypothetical protein